MTANLDRFKKAMNQGHSAAWDQQWDKAAEFYKQALAESSDNPTALTSLGLAYYEMTDYLEAQKYYLRAARVSPNDPVPFEKAAQISETLGNVNEAVNNYFKAAEAFAKNRDVNKAIEAWIKVTQLQPDHMLAHSRLALVYERLGRKQAAVMEMIALASLLQKAGDVKKAMQTMTHALQVAPNSNEAGRALSMLNKGQMLPTPSRPHPQNLTSILLPASQPTAPEETKFDKAGLDPIAETRQRALAELAGLLFDQGDEEVETSQAARKGLGSIVLGSGSGGRGQIDTTRIYLYLSQVIELQSIGRTSQAMDELWRAMETGLDHPAAFFDLGLLQTELGKNENALPNLQKAIKHQNYAVGGRLLLGQAYQKLNRLPEAASTYLEALMMADAEIVPINQAEELRQLYEPLVEAQASQSAEEQEKLCKNVSELLIKPNWREQLNRARQQMVPSQPSGAPPIPLAEILTESHGSKVVESITRIHQLARLSYYRAAMEEAFHALQFAPTYLPLHTYIGELLLQQGHVQNAVDKFTVVARSYGSRGQPRRAVEVYRRLTELSPMDMNVRNHLIEQLVALGQSEEALTEYIRLAEVYYNLADLAMARNTYLEALRLAQQSTVDRSWKVRILHQMADIDMQSLDWRQALRMFEQIRALQPDDDKARSNLVDLNLRLGSVQQALAELDDYVSYLVNRKQLEQAVKFTANLASETPRQPGIRRRLAELYHKVGRTQEAIDELDAAGDMMMETGDRAGAVEAIKAILALNPPNAEEYQRVLDKIKTR
jgi:tetratricopeptide (TPR) repeat protein